MFTGLVACVGTVAAVERSRGIRRLTIVSEWPAAELADGESIAIDGVCLTVAARAGDRFTVDVIPETLARTTLGGHAPGRRVNLERALRLGDRLGGHLVQGHVDGIGVVIAVEAAGDDRRLAIELPAAVSRYVALKGSVALDGVSLTVAGLRESGCEVALIPETLRRTTLGERRAGEGVNVEVDLLARYLESIFGAAPSRPGSGS
jgi:riboflavin synthase